MPASLTACGVCGHKRKAHGMVTGICHSCRNVHMGDRFPKPEPKHPYEEANFVECPACGGDGRSAKYRVDFTVGPCARCTDSPIPGMVKEEARD